MISSVLSKLDQPFIVFGSFYCSVGIHGDPQPEFPQPCNDRSICRLFAVRCICCLKFFVVVACSGTFVQKTVGFLQMDISGYL